MPQIVLQAGRRSYAIGERGLHIGRAQDNHVVLPDALVSNHHAQLWEQTGQIYVRDLGSTNGTYINGQRLQDVAPLRPGDVLQVGHTSLRVMAVAGRASNTPQTMRVWVLAGLAVVVLLLVVLAAPGLRRAGRDRPVAAGGAAVSTNAPADVLNTLSTIEQARLATVQVVSLFTSGSGSVVDPRGYILTNYHVVEGEQEVLIAVNTSVQTNPPEAAYIAKVVAADRDLDLALLQIIADDDGRPLAAALHLTAIKVGNSDDVRLGDEIDILGFPGVGGETITLTKGTVAGFHNDGALARGWIKTDAEISPGNSGGTVINRKGDLIGIPTWVSSEEQTLGRIGLLRPSNLAQELLRRIPK